MTDLPLEQGTVAWASLEPVTGREQGDHRPVLVVASADYLDAVTSLVIALPITTLDRGWPNHVRVEGASGLERPSWIMTEQPRTLARHRLTSTSGQVPPSCLAEVKWWLAGLFDL